MLRPARAAWQCWPVSGAGNVAWRALDPAGFEATCAPVFLHGFATPRVHRFEGGNVGIKGALRGGCYAQPGFC